MNKHDKCMKYVDDYIKKEGSDKSSIEVRVDDGTRYLMAQQYLEGFNDGIASVLDKVCNSKTK